ncbi:MAG: 30S ribosome-binding factor RbfA [SAR324 cluster bacterium]|nr:30S ribosome-binding factor RbfA [SAR324 cluster bacterium]
MSGRKREHLNETIRQKLAQLLIKEAADPRFASVTITGVTVSKDYSSALVLFSSYLPDANPEILAESLNKAAGFLGQALGRSLATRRTPRLNFHYDPGFDHADEMDRILKEIPLKKGPPGDG